MGDLSFIRRNGSPFCDLVIENGDLKIGDELETFVTKAILTDKRVSIDEYQNSKIGTKDSSPLVLRGWWGDTYSDIPGHKIGSKVWLNTRQKQTSVILESQIEYVKEALKPLVEDEVADEVDVQAKWIDSMSMHMKVEIIKPDSSVESFEFEYAWEGL